VEREGRIKLHVISNPAISLDHQISSIQRSTTVVDPPTITQLQLRSLGDELNHTQVMVYNPHRPLDQVKWKDRIRKDEDV
jgi:hypothetical protein